MKMPGKNITDRISAPGTSSVLCLVDFQDNFKKTFVFQNNLKRASECKRSEK
jgi:hypothetical protein